MVHVLNRLVTADCLQVPCSIRRRPGMPHKDVPCMSMDDPDAPEPQEVTAGAHKALVAVGQMVGRWPMSAYVSVESQAVAAQPQD